EEINTTLRVINDYLTSYTFLDKSLAPDLPPTGPGGRGFNLLDSLNDIADSQFGSMFDFYEAIMVSFKKLKDPHTSFRQPCVSSFYYIIPFIFELNVNQSDQNEKTRYSITVSNGGNPPKTGIDELFLNATNKYLQNYGSVDLRGKRITRMNIYNNQLDDYDGNPLTGTYTAAESIARWADEEIDFGFSPTLRMNEALRNLFSFRPASSYQHPASNSFAVEYIDDDDDQPQTAEIPYYKENIARKLEEKIHPIRKIRVQEFKNRNYAVNQSVNLEKQKQTNADYITLFRLPDMESFYNDIVSSAYIPSQKLGIIRIATFNTRFTRSFAQVLVDSLISFSQPDGDRQALNLIIDLRSNAGGFVSVGRHSLDFLFPQVSFPLYTINDEIISPMNKELAKIFIEDIKAQPNDSELRVDPLTMIPTFDWINGDQGRTRTTILRDEDVGNATEVTQGSTTTDPSFFACCNITKTVFRNNI
ncbi:MAG: hypothetical protein EZS28_041546, partial [Streblomastix strix]